ncbi:MAG: type II secretion system F family protein [Azospirillaceae bacterium]|nr:type II secretion system F family protein [Azospirillaceae bacterium]
MTIPEALATIPQIDLITGLLLIAGGVLLLLAIAAEMTRSRRELVMTRIQRLTATSAATETVAPDIETLDSAAPVVQRGGIGGALHGLLAGAEGRISVAPLLPVALVAAAAVALASIRVFQLVLPLAILIAVPAGLIAAIMMARRQRRRHTLRFLDALPDAIDMVVRAVFAGIPVGEALSVAGNEVEEPVRSEFKRIAASVQLGVDLKDALHEAAERVALPDFDFFVVALVVQRETGGQLSETLQNLTVILRRRKETRLKLKALTAEGRFTAQVISSLPFLAGGFIELTQPDFLAPLFTDPTGRMLLLIAVGCLATGMFVIAQMVKGEA